MSKKNEENEQRFGGRLFANQPDIDDPTVDPYTSPVKDLSTSPEGMNLVASLTRSGRQAPILDLDIPHRYVPSSTPGHGHLFIDVELSQEQYGKVLAVLVGAGLIDYGTLARFDTDGATFARLNKKEAKR